MQLDSVKRRLYGITISGALARSGGCYGFARTQSVDERTKSQRPLGALGMVAERQALFMEGRRNHAGAQLVRGVDHHGRSWAKNDSNAQSGIVRRHDQHRAYFR